MKVFYATLVSKYRNTACVRAWTDTNKLAVAYGDRKISAIIKMPSSLAYIVLICVSGNKLKYNKNDLLVYSMFLSIITEYMERNGDKIFFYNTTRGAYLPTTTKKENE